MLETTLNWYTLDGLFQAHADGEISDLNFPEAYSRLTQKAVKDKIMAVAFDEFGNEYYVKLKPGFSFGNILSHIAAFTPSFANALGMRVGLCYCPACKKYRKDNNLITRNGEQLRRKVRGA